MYLSQHMLVVASAVSNTSSDGSKRNGRQYFLIRYPTQL